jgi:lipopolysaccharide-induced tumor necrosis factor-alpha factor
VSVTFYLLSPHHQSTTMSNPVPTQDMKISYVDPNMNPAGNPPMAYAGAPQYASTGVPPPGQYQQWAGPPGSTPNHQSQQPMPSGYQYNPGVPQFVPQQPGAPLTATPIPALNRSSAPVDCPVCGTRALTSTRKVVGSSNQSVCFPQLSIPYLSGFYQLVGSYRLLLLLCGMHSILARRPQGRRTLVHQLWHPPRDLPQVGRN